MRTRALIVAGFTDFGFQAVSLGSKWGGGGEESIGLYSSAKEGAEYSATFIETPSGQRTVRLEKSGKVMSSIVLPSLLKNESITDACRPASTKLSQWHNSDYNKPSNYMIGIATFAPGKTETRNVRRAWSINWKTFQFDEVDVSKVVCELEDSNE